MAEADANDARVTVIGVLQLVLLVLTAVAFLMWLHRSYADLGSAGFARRWSPGWAVGWWFILVMCLFRPYQVMADLWRASSPGASPSSWRSQPGTALLGWWWAAFLMGGFVGQQAAKLSFSSSTSLDDLKIMTATSVASDAIWALGGILAVILVWQIRSRLGGKASSQVDDVADREKLDSLSISPETA